MERVDWKVLSLRSDSRIKSGFWSCSHNEYKKSCFNVYVKVTQIHNTVIDRFFNRDEEIHIFCIHHWHLIDLLLGEEMEHNNFYSISCIYGSSDQNFEALSPLLCGGHQGLTLILLVFCKKGRCCMRVELWS